MNYSFDFPIIGCYSRFQAIWNILNYFRIINTLKWKLDSYLFGKTISTPLFAAFDFKYFKFKVVFT